jgi:predicted neuraminidase
MPARLAHSAPFLIATLLVLGVRAQEPSQQATVSEERTVHPFTSELVFPLHPKHNHAPSVVELSNGDLLASWYRGSGERTADDVAVYGARLKKGDTGWSEAFLMADTPGFPDCNTAMSIDPQGRLWLFWPTILANTWESCLTNYYVSDDYLGEGSPKWSDKGLVLLKPEDFSADGERHVDEILAKYGDQMTDRLREEAGAIRRRMNNKLYQRLGWQPRCKPTYLSSGRILLPLYTDTFSISIMAISDDHGATWYSSQPLFGFGNIQPAVLERSDGTLVAYMRDNGPFERVRVCESTDQGLTWGPVYSGELENPGAGVDAVRLANGHWVIIYNDQVRGRTSLAVSLSTDEGRSWTATRHLEQQESGAYHYPAIIQGSDGRIHAIYSYFVDGGKSMKHAAFDEAWITESGGDGAVR